MAIKLIDILVQLHHETKPEEDNEGAVLVSTDGNKESAVWIPKSQIEMETTRVPGQRFITIPDYMAVEKGLI